MKKLIFSFVLVFVFSATATHSVANDNETVWEKTGNSYSYNNCVVKHLPEKKTLNIHVHKGSNEQNVTLIRKNNFTMKAVLEYYPFTYQISYREDTPSGEDLFTTQCSEAAKHLPEGVKALFGSHWGVNE